jgi:hypothetical protein
MNKTPNAIKISSVSLLVLMLFSLNISSCGDKAREIYGYVTDSEGRGMPNILVTTTLPYQTTNEGCAGPETITRKREYSSRTDSDGYYTIKLDEDVIATESSTIGPSSYQYSFSPARRSVALNRSLDFKALSVAYRIISGKVVRVDGSGISGVSINLTGDSTNSTSTDASGNYSFGVNKGSYTITPLDIEVQPESLTVTVDLSDISNLYFVEYGLSVSGRITTDSGEPIPGASIKLSGEFDSMTTTDADGNYIFPALYYGSYAISPMDCVDLYSPSQINLFVSDTDLTEQNFTVQETLSDISGTITDIDGIGIEGITVNLSDIHNSSAVTDMYGFYNLTNIQGGTNYKVDLSGSCCFLISDREVLLCETNQSGIDFASTATMMHEYAGFHISSMIKTSSGGYAVAGYSSSPEEDYDFWVMRLDPYGNVLWQKTYGDSNSQEANSIVETSDGGYAVAGYSYSDIKLDDFWVMKLDPDGNVLWQKTYGDSDSQEANSIVETSDGGYAVAGRSSSPEKDYDFWVMKLDPDGNVLWQKTYGDSNYQRASSIVETSDGGYAVAGRSYSPEKNFDFWVMKLDPSGNVLWQKTYGDSDSQGAWSIVETSDGGYAVAGYSISNIKPFDSWVIRLDPDGNVLWQKKYGDSDRQGAASIVETSDGGYAVAGDSYSIGEDRKIWVMKLDASGNILWQNKYFNTFGVVRSIIVETSNGGYAVAGSGLEGSSILVTDSSGELELCDYQASTNATASDISITPIDSDATVIDTNFTVTDTYIVPIDALSVGTQLCPTP